MRKTGFYWLADMTDATKSHVVAYYEKGSWLFCGSEKVFSNQDIDDECLVVVSKV